MMFHRRAPSRLALATSGLGLILAFGAAGAPALAEDRAFLPKADIEGLASGRKWTQTFENGTATTWDLRKDGGAQTNFQEATRNRVGTVNGKWTVDEEGRLCIVWRGPRLDDQCVRVAKQDEKLVLVDAKTGRSSILTVE